MASTARPERAARTRRTGMRRTEHSGGADVVVTWHWRLGHERTVVLVHGIGMSHRYYARLVEALTPHVDVVVVDLPGFGRSPRPAASVSMPACADLLAAALRELRIGPVVALGHSMGSQVVAELAVAHPHLVERLVLVAPTADIRERSMHMQILRLTQDSVHFTPGVGALGVRMYLQAGPRWVMTQLRAMLEHRIEAVAPRIEQPTLVVRGELDRVCARDWAQHVAALLPDGRMLEVEGEGHDVIVTGADALSHLIRELAP